MIFVWLFWCVAFFAMFIAATLDKSGWSQGARVSFMVFSAGMFVIGALMAWRSW